MQRYKAENDRKIENSLAGLRKRKDELVKAGMYRLLEAGLSYLQEAHDPDMKHENEANTLGWILIHNGEIVEAVAQDRGPYTPSGDVLGRLSEMAATAPKTGWLGIVMSDMANDWYRVDWEMGFLKVSADRVKAEFGMYFKKVA